MIKAKRQSVAAAKKAERGGQKGPAGPGGKGGRGQVKKWIYENKRIIISVFVDVVAVTSIIVVLIKRTGKKILQKKIIIRK